MAECLKCERKFRIKGKTITEKTPDYVKFEYPRRGTEYIFCSIDCMLMFFGKRLAERIIFMAKT